MDLQRTLLIGAVAVVGVFTLQQWNEDYNQTRPTGEEAITSMSNVSIAQSGTDMPTLSSDNTGPVALDGNTKPSAQLVSVKTDTLNVQIDPAGGDIIGLSLPKYPAWLPEDDKKVPPFELMVQNPNCVNGDVTCVYTAQSALVRADGPQANNQRPLYNVKTHTYTLQSGQDKVVVDLTRSTDEINLTKRFTFTRGSYDIRMDYQIENKGSTVWADRFYAQLKRDNSPDPSTVNSSAPMNTYLGAAVRSTDKPYLKLDFKDFGKNKFEENIDGGYAAMLQLYFVSAWVPNQSQRHTFYTNLSQDGQYNFVGFIDNITVQPGQTATFGADLYAGPKDQKNMKALADGLQLTMDFGWLWFLAQPIFKWLKFIQSFVGNWGWSIILLTISVKALFYPLNATSFRSMAKMRKLGPKMAELKEKHGEDRQKLSQEMMELYKKEKVNPMGGCLPILVQMPVFIALYWVLQEAVELRQAPWLGWIQDLSQMDPYFILPLIMGASMFAQQLLNPTPPDPVQAKVMKLMPVIFTVFFLWFPAGLVLYWVTNNTLSIIQQYIITKKIEKEGT
ncbi:membrane protein insertase YidC [Endozoicomonas sp. (ex Bugula neritina AB1)]|nr:membrane protein insertase YidC [Endozoicomonas sp. (ex Bugula neritina AB1)]